MGPSEADLKEFTDKYFLKTREIVGQFGDCDVTYAVFMRRPVIFTPRLAVGWLRDMAAARDADVHIEMRFAEGDWVGAGEPLMYITGPFRHLVDLETVFLQRLGAPPAWRRSTPFSCAPISPMSPSSPWMRATAPAPTWPT